jgi:hypothetical protein
MNEQNEKLMNDCFRNVGLSADWVDDAWSLWQNGESHSSYGLVAVEGDGETIDLYYASGNVADKTYEVLGSEAGYYLLAREVPVSVVLKMRQERILGMVAHIGKLSMMERNQIALLDAAYGRKED